MKSLRWRRSADSAIAVTIRSRCAVKAAVESGAILAERDESYLKLSREHAVTEKLRDERSLLDAKRQARIGSKAMKAIQKSRGR